MKIICVGRNYIDHAKELNNPVPEKPVIFLKPETAQIPKRNPLYYPEFTKDLHYEVEIVVRIDRLGKHIEERFAHKYYNKIGVGIDFTARDLQRECKEKGLPWERSKAFDSSAPFSREMIPVSKVKDVQNINFHLNKNGETVQKGNTGDMIFNINYLVSHISSFITLKKGDMIFTGTPKGVGPCKIGDRLEAFIEDEKMLKVDIR